MSDLSILIMLVQAGDEVPGTTDITGRSAGAWHEFYEAIPGAGFRFWAKLIDRDTYVAGDWCDPSDGSKVSEAYLDTLAAHDGTL